MPRKSKKQATIDLLREDGHHAVADDVEAWRSDAGTHQGWDEWFKKHYKDLAKKYKVGSR